MTDPRCPTCGEQERLTGHTVDDVIEIRCDACGATWTRADRSCRTCGRPESTVARQRMTTYPRGNQLAVIGMRDVPLCPHCDREALAALGSDRLVDEGYRSRFVSGPDVEEAATRATNPPPRRSHEPGGNESGSHVPAAHARSQPPRTTASTRPVRPEAPSAPVTDPTVRHAVDAYLSHCAGTVGAMAGATAMLVLGRELGPSTRLRDVTPAAWGSLDEAVDKQWARDPGKRALAVAAIDDAVDLWTANGWIDLEAAPRPSRPQ